MSVISTPTTIRLAEPRAVTTDLIIIIGGYGSEDVSERERKPLPATPAYSASGDLLRRVQGGELIPASGHVIQTMGLKGQLLDIDVRAAIAFIQNCFDPWGKLILCGHSMGGVAVQDVCRLLERQYWHPYKNCMTGVQTFYNRGLGQGQPGQLPPQAMPGPPWTLRPDTSVVPNPRVGVDLLLTTDAAMSVLSKMTVDRSIPSCVKTNLNYYQTTRIWEDKVSCGEPNYAVDRRSTIVWNHDLTGRAIPDADSSKAPHAPDHNGIQAQLNNMYMKIMQQALTTDQVTDFWDLPPAGF